ncbi:hypothetical protein ACMFMG_002367 [Clarireedia jacksonii]
MHRERTTPTTPRPSTLIESTPYHSECLTAKTLCMFAVLLVEPNGESKTGSRPRPRRVKSTLSARDRLKTGKKAYSINLWRRVSNLKLYSPLGTGLSSDANRN